MYLTTLKKILFIIGIEIPEETINILNQNLINLPDSEFKNKFIEADFSNNFKKLINKAQNFRNDCHKYEYIIDKDEIIKIPVN